MREGEREKEREGGRERGGCISCIQYAYTYVPKQLFSDEWSNHFMFPMPYCTAQSSYHTGLYCDMGIRH